MRVLTTTVSALACAALAATASAQNATQPAPLQLSIGEAITRGLEQSPRVAEARAKETGAAAAVTARKVQKQPDVTALASYQRTNHVEDFGVRQPDGSTLVIFPDVPNNYRVRAQVTVPIYTGGRVDAQVRSAEREELAVTADREAVEDEVTLDLTRAYWGLVTSRERVAVLEQALARADAVVNDVRARLDAGVVPPNELLSAQAQRARQSVQLIQARRDAVMAEVTLGRLLGLPPDTPITPTTPVSQPTQGAADLIAQPVPTLVARAREIRPERRGLLQRQDSYQISAEASLANLKPRFDALASVEPSRPNTRFVPRTDEWRLGWDIGGTLSWPLWDGGRARAASAQALAQAEAVTHRIREFDAALSIDVRQRVLDVEASRAALDASDQAVAAAAEARRVVEERFSVGVATSTEVLDAQLKLVEAELERTQLLAGLRVDEARLVRAVGGL
jgi:outer membrane protein TolC